MNDFETLRVQEAGAILTVTLHRPERRNALNPAMMDELMQVLDAAARRTACVLLLTGAGAAFCAGLDIEHLRALSIKSPAEHAADAERMVQLFRALYALPIPTIAAVQGPALAGGMGLATLCDFTLAAHGAQFGYTEVRIGFIPAMVSAFLALQIGEKNVRDLLLTGRLISAEEAQRMGLVNAVVEPEALLQHAQALAQTLLQNSPEAMRATKQMLLERVRPQIDAALRDAIPRSVAARATEDFREGVTAFLEKRRPQWPSATKKCNERK
jgi:methylglutaconyl-CoA hydratase